MKIKSNLFEGMTLITIITFLVSVGMFFIYNIRSTHEKTKNRNQIENKIYENNRNNEIQKQKLKEEIKLLNDKYQQYEEVFGE